MQLRILLALICFGLADCAHQRTRSSSSSARVPEHLICVRVMNVSPTFYECKPNPVNSLPTWRKGVGGAAITLGAVAVVLGITHMIVPIFKTEHGCNSMGVDSECVLDRFGGGVPLVVGGVLLGGVGGGFALGYPE